MKTRPSSEAPVIARDILAYLLRHPDASDTLEGIGRWWLVAQQAERTIPEFRAALAELNEKGLVNARRQRDGRIVYRLNREKEVEIRRQLSSSSTTCFPQNVEKPDCRQCPPPHDAG